jgi:hypothetical protein
MKMNGYSLPVPVSSVKKIVSDELRISLTLIFVQKRRPGTRHQYRNKSPGKSHNACP